MFKLNRNIVIALCTACAILAFAFYERHHPSGSVPDGVYFLGAAAIALIPALTGSRSCASCRNKTPDVS
jgi:hypothetical protein